MQNHSTEDIAVEDEEDEVVEEIPIYLTKNMRDNLFLLQYPIKTYVDSYDNVTISSCQVKSSSKDIKLDIALDLTSSNYDRARGKSIAKIANNKHDKPIFQHDIMDKHTIVSARTFNNVYKYLGGVYADGELHLTPLCQAVQMRPTKSYLEDGEKRRKDDKRHKRPAKANNVDDDDDDDEDEDDEEEERITAKLAKPGTSKRLKPQLPVPIIEPWRDMIYHQRTTPLAEIERQRMYCTTQETSAAFSQDMDNYVNIVFQRHVPRSIEDILPPIVMSKSRLFPLPLNEQLKYILTDVILVYIYFIGIKYLKI